MFVLSQQGHFSLGVYLYTKFSHTLFVKKSKMSDDIINISKNDFFIPKLYQGRTKKSLPDKDFSVKFCDARPAGLEPVTSPVTGECSNQIELRAQCGKSNRFLGFYQLITWCRGWVTIPLPWAYESHALPIELPRQWNKYSRKSQKTEYIKHLVWGV